MVKIHVKLIISFCKIFFKKVFTWTYVVVSDAFEQDVDAVEHIGVVVHVENVVQVEQIVDLPLTLPGSNPVPAVAVHPAKVAD